MRIDSVRQKARMLRDEKKRKKASEGGKTTLAGESKKCRVGGSVGLLLLYHSSPLRENCFASLECCPHGRNRQGHLLPS